MFDSSFVLRKGVENTNNTKRSDEQHGENDSQSSNVSSYSSNTRIIHDTIDWSKRNNVNVNDKSFISLPTDDFFKKSKRRHNIPSKQLTNQRINNRNKYNSSYGRMNINDNSDLNRPNRSSITNYNNNNSQIDSNYNNKYNNHKNYSVNPSNMSKNTNNSSKHYKHEPIIKSQWNNNNKNNSIIKMDRISNNSMNSGSILGDNDSCNKYDKNKPEILSSTLKINNKNKSEMASDISNSSDRNERSSIHSNCNNNNINSNNNSIWSNPDFKLIAIVSMIFVVCLAGIWAHVYTSQLEATTKRIESNVSLQIENSQATTKQIETNVSLQIENSQAATSVKIKQLDKDIEGIKASIIETKENTKKEIAKITNNTNLELKKIDERAQARSDDTKKMMGHLYVLFEFWQAKHHCYVNAQNFSNKISWTQEISDRQRETDKCHQIEMNESSTNAMEPFGQ